MDVIKHRITLEVGTLYKVNTKHNCPFHFYKIIDNKIKSVDYSWKDTTPLLLYKTIYHNPTLVNCYFLVGKSRYLVVVEPYDFKNNFIKIQ